MLPTLTRRLTAAFIVVTALLSSCVTRGQRPAADVETLARWMCGSFRAEARADEGHELGELRLDASPLWTERADGRWIYVERALVARPAEPYWQRIVHVRAQGADLVSDTYMLPGDVRRFAGAGTRPAVLDELVPERLPMRAGCSLHWTRRPDGSFAGTTRSGMCPSDLRGAHHAMSTANVSAARTSWWDRGFDTSGDQVWGTSGPCVFERETKPAVEARRTSAGEAHELPEQERGGR